jgi:outer membrane receptor protein involved in Fe transport
VDLVTLSSLRLSRSFVRPNQSHTMQTSINGVSRTRHPVLRPSAFFFAGLLVLSQSLFSQQTPAPAPTSVAEEEPVKLSPFVVDANQDVGYAAKDTLAGSRIRTELKDVGSSISVVTQKFLQDTNSKNNEQLLVYTTNTEVAGQGGNFLGQGDGAFVTASNNANRAVPNTRVRGLAEADNTRDFNLTDIPWDSYNVGRVDLQRGPNSILFGIGSPAGIINSSLNVASFKDAFKFENQFGSFDSLRFTANLNKVLIKNELAVRVDAVHDHTKYRQDPAFKKDKRVFSAVKWDPSFLNKGDAHTSLRVNYEDGRIKSNMPRYTPPIDTISPWFTAMGKATYDGRTLNNAVPNAYIGSIGNRVYDGVITTFSNGTQGISYPSQFRQYPDPNGGVAGANAGNNGLKGITTTDNFAKNSQLPGAGSGLWKAASLTDRGVFDFYNNLIEGPNKSEFNNFHAFNAALSQTFLRDRLGFEVSYDRQNARWGNDTSMAEDGTTVTIDINHTLLNGQANPNVGRPMVVLGGGSAGVWREERTREVARVTGFGELNFADISGKESRLAKIFGRNTFTGLYSDQEDKDQNQKGPRWYLPSSFAPNAGAGGVGQASRDNIMLAYVGPSLSSAANASGLGFQGLKQKITPVTSTISVWNNSTNSFQSLALPVYDSDNFGDSAKTYTQGFKSTNNVKSSAFIWQGYWFNHTIVPMIGIRRDSLEHRGAATPGLTGVSGAVDINSPLWQLPTAPVNPNNNPKGLTFQDVSGTSKTYSLVTHLPPSLREKMPGRIGVSVFGNRSENFRPESRRDIMGAPLPAATGETKEYGVAITALDDKLTLKVVHYDTRVTNATINGALNGFYLIGANEWWGGAAARAQRDANSWQAGNFGTATNGRIVTWQPDATTVSSGTPIFQPDGVTYTQAALDQTRARIDLAVTDWFAKLAPASIQSAWEFVQQSADGPQNKEGNYSPSGMSLTGNTRSEGYEFELIANPIKGLDVSFNASKTTAQRSDLASGYTDWILKRWTDLQGPMGDIRLWGGGSGGETARSKFRNETYAGYLLFQALEGTDAPEIHKWRYNVVSNYSFQGEKLRGANIGGSYRWQDRSTIGFFSKTSVDTISNTPIDVADLSRPIKGKSEGTVDLWLGYERKFARNLKWRIQFNVRNAFADNDLVPTTVQPNGVIATFRIPEPRTWTVTNSIDF